MKKINQTVFVGLSGGVDSSTVAWMLQRQGYRVVGAYMKNWSQDIGNWRCPWRSDYLAAKDVASFLGIDLVVFDFEKDYKRLIVDHMLAEYQAGRTPNPDIRCNQLIKFDLFFRACLDRGADLIATGHYARTDGQSLMMAQDKFKDQTYFLYRIPQPVLAQTLFPLGSLLKQQVRKRAQAAGLPTANRAESMGLCFVGQIGLVDFLQAHIKTQSGPIICLDDGRTVGQHQGAILYTIGQRQGLNIGGRSTGTGSPYYVVKKDVTKNEVYVTQRINSPGLWSDRVAINDQHWLTKPPRKGQNYQVRLRHQGQLQLALVIETQPFIFQLKQPIRAVTTGQSLVVYDVDQNKVVGGGIIDHQL